jgi:hypothetical protein
MFKLVTTGSRQWTDRKRIASVLTTIRFFHPEILIAQGESPGGGADFYVADYCSHAVEQGGSVKAVGVAVDTKLDGDHLKVRYLNRNKRMLDTIKPDMVVAFRSEGKSNGTDHTIKEAHKRGIKVLVIHE